MKVTPSKSSLDAAVKSETGCNGGTSVVVTPPPSRKSRTRTEQRMRAARAVACYSGIFSVQELMKKMKYTAEEAAKEKLHRAIRRDAATYRKILDIPDLKYNPKQNFNYEFAMKKYVQACYVDLNQQYPEDIYRQIEELKSEEGAPHVIAMLEDIVSKSRK